MTTASWVIKSKLQHTRLYRITCSNTLQRIPKRQSKKDNLEKLANKRQRIPKRLSKKDNPEKLTNKRQRIPKRLSKKDNPEKLATYGTHDEEKQAKTTAQYVLDTTVHKQTQIT